MNLRATILSSLAVLTFCLFAAATASAQGEVVPSKYHDFRVVTVADGLEHPWAIAFLPDGDMLVTERGGDLHVVRNGELLPDPVPGLPAVRAEGQGGLLDVVPHPNFAENRLIYLSFSKPNADASESTTAVVRGRFENDRLTDVEEVFEAAAWSAGNGHYGSRIAFDGNGHMFITVGDRQVPPQGDLAAHPAQDLSNHQGTVIRLHEDGSVPSDNPFVGQDGVLPEIWSYGHRNSQGLAIHPETGDVWLVEHGPQGGDELNRPEPGKNYGWPVVGYGGNYGTGEAIHSATMLQGMEPPVHIWVPSIATSGLTIYSGDAFPEWQGDFFIGGLRGQQVARLEMDGPQVIVEETVLYGYGRIRDVRQGPEGHIYLAVDDSSDETVSILRLDPVR